MFSKTLIDKLIVTLKVERDIDVSEIEAQSICLRLAQFTYSKLLDEKDGDG